jgi:hypothetical protein
MYERQQIWHKRFVLRKDRPWTDDEIFNNSKFTNVYRELDRASQWVIRTVMMDTSLTIEDYLFRNIIARFFNRPETFDKSLSDYALELPHYKDFDSKKLWREIMQYRDKVGNPWHTAYLMNPGMAKNDSWNKEGKFRDDIYANKVFNDVHRIIPQLKKVLLTAKEPMEIITVLEKILAVSRFMSHEFYIDFCYAARFWKRPIMKFNENDYTNVGPGASTGIRLIFPSMVKQIDGIYLLRDLAENYLSNFSEDFKYIQWDKEEERYDIVTDCNINLHQIEMWLCEYQKYWKMRIGVGKQRSKFKPITLVK